MFRSQIRMCGIIAPRQPVSKTMVAATHGVSRVLGGKNERFATAADYKNIAAKAKNSATSDVANLGAALALNRLGLADEVIEITSKLTESTGSGGLLGRAAKSLKARSLSAKLEAARSAALVSGSATEDAVSSLTTAVDAELSELAKRGHDFGSKLAYAEFLLSCPNPRHGVAEAFSAAVDSVNTATTTVSKTVSHDVTSASTLTLLARYQSTLKQAIAAAEMTGACSNGAKMLLNSDRAGIPQTREAMDEYKASLQDSGVASDSELVALATVQASIETNHHHFDFFDNADGNYKLWANGFCTPFANQLNSFAHPEQGFATGRSALDARIKEIGRPVSGNFYGNMKNLEDALNQKDGDVLDNVLTACGSAPQNALATGEESYFELTSMLDKFVVAHPSLGHGSSKTESHLLNLQKNALEQLAFRATVGKAVALERNNKLNESLTQLDAVINENRYLHMWKALLARGRANRALGHLDAAEKDFSVLHSLKSQEGYDIPQLDENRYKSVF